MDMRCRVAGHMYPGTISVLNGPVAAPGTFNKCYYVTAKYDCEFSGFDDFLTNFFQGFKPSKYFSIDRVFRNETLDATHLAEFHQVEGVVADYNLTLGDLIGMQWYLKRKSINIFLL